MQPKRKSSERQTKLELYVTWMLGGLLLLVSNSTVFKSFNASIGEPWFNLMLSALILLMLGKITVTLIYMKRSARSERANIAAIDRMETDSFSRYMEAYFRYEGWVVRQAGTGGGLVISREGRTVLVALRSSRRKLSQEAVVQAESLRGQMGADEAWVVTNGGFTSQARREAAKLGHELWDRSKLVRVLSRINAAWKFKPID